MVAGSWGAARLPCWGLVAFPGLRPPGQPRQHPPGQLRLSGQAGTELVLPARASLLQGLGFD